MFDKHFFIIDVLYFSCLWRPHSDKSYRKTLFFSSKSTRLYEITSCIHLLPSFLQKKGNSRPLLGVKHLYVNYFLRFIFSWKEKQSSVKYRYPIIVQFFIWVTLVFRSDFQLKQNKLKTVQQKISWQLFYQIWRKTIVLVGLKYSYVFFVRLS